MIDELAARYRRNLFDSVIPFWLRHSLDRVHGGQFTCLTRDGAIYDRRKYIWMQGRAVWMFSRLYNEVERREEWLDAARCVFDFLMQYGFDAEGRCWFSVTEDGRPAFFQRKPYAAFFAVLALAEYSKTGAAPADAVERAKALSLRVTGWIADGSLLGRPPLSGQTPVRQLADIMVAASMALELLPVDPHERQRATLRECLRQAREHWLPDRRVLLENLPLDGSDWRDSPDTRLSCPGSALETAWFLWRAQEELGVDDAGWLMDVIEASLESGWDREHGGLHYFQDALGLPPLQLDAPMKLWWPHTEAICALVMAYTKSGDARWLAWLRRVDEYTFRTFVDWEHGEWFGYCDRYGRPTHALKGGPYKGSFHVPRCLLFTLQRLNALRP